MPFEVRLHGAPIGTFESGEDAEAKARDMVARDPDQVPEIIDADTGKPYAPGATHDDREHLARKMGY